MKIKAPIFVRFMDAGIDDFHTNCTGFSYIFEKAAKSQDFCLGTFVKVCAFV